MALGPAQRPGASGLGQRRGRRGAGLGISWRPGGPGDTAVGGFCGRAGRRGRGPGLGPRQWRESPWDAGPLAR
jgi:hypothetical protein